MKALVKWTAIDFLTRHIVGIDKPSYVPSAATGTVNRRPPKITRAVPGIWGWDSSRRNRSSHCHSRHKCCCRQQQNDAPHINATSLLPQPTLGCSYCDNDRIARSCQVSGAAVASIHPAAEKGYSRKLISRILHTTGPNGLETS